MLKNKKGLLIGFILMLTVIVFIIGTTYAYFTAEIIGNDTASTIKVDVGNLVIDFETSEYINNISGELIQDSQKATEADYTNFTVKHNASSKGTAQYQLSLTEIAISDNMKSADFKWELLKNGKIIESGNFLNIGNSTTMLLTDEVQTLIQNQNDSYSFRIWLSETDVDQSNLYSGTFSAKVSLVSKST